MYAFQKGKPKWAKEEILILEWLLSFLRVFGCGETERVCVRRKIVKQNHFGERKVSLCESVIISCNH